MFTLYRIAFRSDTKLKKKKIIIIISRDCSMNTYPKCAPPL